jgi:very-short-patch-repair endonuclease
MEGHLVERRVLVRVGSRVLVVAGSPPGPRQDLAIVQLDAGPQAAISHEAAAALFQLPGFFFGPLDVSRARRPERGTIFIGELHEPSWLPEEHIIEFEGIRVTRVPRLVFDLAGTLTEGRFRRTFANVVSKHPSVLRELHRMLPAIARRGRPGIALMREVLEANPVGSVVEESGLEGRVIRILADAGIAVRKQVDVGDDARWIGRVDMKLVDEPVTIEVDSYLYHGSLLDQAADAARDDAMNDAGFGVARISEDQVWHRPWEVVAKVQKARVEVRAKSESRPPPEPRQETGPLGPVS